MILRLSLETWIKTEKKIPKNINFPFIKSKKGKYLKSINILTKIKLTLNHQWITQLTIQKK